MPHREDEPLLQEAAEGATRRIRTAWAGFVDFALKDNVLEVAVGLM